jgi:tetratricopeptide (TPR) repeat protein
LSKVTQIRQRARTYLQKGKFDKAIEEYKRLTGMETKNPNYFNELGDIYLKAGDSIQAVSNFEKAVVNYEKVALYNNAVAVCKKILRILPTRGDTIYKLGELRAKQKLGGEARVYFSQYLDHILANADSAGPELNGKINGILELVPEHAEILGKTGDALVMIGIKTGALEIYCKLSSDAERAGEKDQAASPAATGTVARRPPDPKGLRPLRSMTDHQ